MADDVKNNDNQRLDPADALAAMARRDVVVSDPGEFAAAGAETAAEDVFAGSAAPSGVPGGLHVTAGDGYQRHHAYMYKKTMIPLLLVAGAMLVVIGLISAAMWLGSAPEQKFDPRMKLVLFVSFPLAAAVLAGAWWFRRDLTR